MPRFLDTNILLRYFTNDDPVKGRHALVLLHRIERGEEKVAMSLLVVSETVFTLERHYKVPKDQVREKVRDLVSLAGVQLPAKSACLAALDLYDQLNISFADAYNVVEMQARGLTEIYSWDTDFDKLPGLLRVEPDGHNG